jgi:hypothetical protein
VRQQQRTRGVVEADMSGSLPLPLAVTCAVLVQRLVLLLLDQLWVCCCPRLPLCSAAAPDHPLPVPALHSKGTNLLETSGMVYVSVTGRVTAIHFPRHAIAVFQVMMKGLQR